MYRNHHAAFSSRTFFISRHLKAIVPYGVLNVGVPARNQKPAVRVLFARTTNRIYKNLIVLIQICIVLLVRVAIICTVRFFVHGFENQMFVILCKAFRDLLPYRFILFANHILIFAVYQEPAAVNAIIAIAVHIDNHIQSLIIAILHHFFHTVQPSGIHLIAVRIINAIQIGNRHTNSRESSISHCGNQFLCDLRIAPYGFVDFSAGIGFQLISHIPAGTHSFSDLVHTDGEIAVVGNHCVFLIGIFFFRSISAGAATACKSSRHSSCQCTGSESFPKFHTFVPPNDIYLYYTIESEAVKNFCGISQQNSPQNRNVA